MAEKFILVWIINGETISMSHSTQDEALRQAEKLLREHGCDLEITLHLDRISPPPPFGSIRSGCRIGVWPDSRPFKSK
jgi:hypothetical protein